MFRSLLPKRSTYIIIFIVLIAGNTGIANFPRANKVIAEINRGLYDHLKLGQIGLNENIFEKALKGWNRLHEQKCVDRPTLLSIVDFSQSSNAKRLYVIDMDKKEVLFNTYVSHGRNSGEEYAKSFGNKPECFKSSLGFYLTGAIYKGLHGLSMRLKGVEQGINDFAENRGIVMHGAEYVSESFIKQHGRLGRSQGCPAVPEKECVPIINTIKDGSCFFIFYPDSDYFRRSPVFNQ